MNIMDYEGLTLEDIIKQQPDKKILEKLLNNESDAKKRKKILDAIINIEKH
ncbi:MAG: hypothetical protein JXJ04_14010 [Spirochaetales bacterium]|nr:hypothetical protein [Spirochaetales bacterium]